MKTVFALLFLVFALSLNGAAPAEPSDAGGSVKLFPGDKVTFMIEEDPMRQGASQTAEFIVAPLGDLTVPVSKCCDASITVNVKEKTLAQVQDELKQKLEADYYKKATIHLQLKDKMARVGKVLFSGQVKNSVVTLNAGEQKKLYDALLEVGTTEYANLKKVKLQRKDKETGKMTTTIYDMQAVKSGKQPDAKDPVLEDGDRVEVPERGFSF